ncbi:40S ribosomal protein S7 [Lemmus lemmus]
MNSVLKAQLPDLNITAAKEIEVGGGWKAITIFVPKKFSRKHVVLIAQRWILPKPTRKRHMKTAEAPQKPHVHCRARRHP